MRKAIFLMIFILSISISGCFQGSNGEFQYLESKNGPALTVPPPLAANNINHFYDLPTQQSKNIQMNNVPPSFLKVNDEHRTG